MRVPLFKAKDKDSDVFYKGFYFNYPQTTFCFTEDYEKGSKVKLIHCLAVYTMTDWGLPNRARMVTIDVNTLEQIGEVETTDEFYIPSKYIKKQE